MNKLVIGVTDWNPPAKNYDGYSEKEWFQKSYNTPRYRTPQAIPLPNHERIPGLQPVGKGFSGVCSKGVLEQR